MYEKHRILQNKHVLGTKWVGRGSRPNISIPLDGGGTSMFEVLANMPKQNKDILRFSVLVPLFPNRHVGTKAATLFKGLPEERLPVRDGTQRLDGAIWTDGTDRRWCETDKRGATRTDVWDEMGREAVWRSPERWKSIG